jgi:hypothetical protein
MRLTPDELGRMTPAEYLAMVEGYIEHQKAENKNEKCMALYTSWHIAYLVSYSFNAPDKMPKLDTLLKSIKD